MDDRKERISDETIMRFSREGLKFTLDELVDGMHISKKTVYKQFGKKADLLKTGPYSYVDAYSSEIEPVGHTSAQAPQSMQMLGSIE